MRPKGYLVLLSMALMLILPQLAAARPVHNFACDQCHLANLTINEIGGDNVCLTCHGDPTSGILLNTGDTVASDAGFVEGDASDQYGNNPAPADEISHNWAASSTNPAAGAAEPSSGSYPGFYSRYGTTHGKVACSRCHDPHAEIETNPKLLRFEADGVTPMSPNTMCTACHVDFANALQADHGLLSHPIVADYNAFQQTDATTQANYKLASTIPSYNASTPYANGVQLVDGGITCLTCHNIHYVDSDAATLDGPTQTLNPGDGLLLRGDGEQFTTTAGGDIEAGTYPTGDSICNDCHNYETSLHGTAAVGCLACHGGHEYNGGVPNYYMLNDPTGSYTTRPITGAEKSAAWGGTQAGVIDGFCENCHGNIETDWSEIRDHTANLGEDCTNCHLDHSSGAFSDPVGCDGCHGSPPEVDAPGNTLAGAAYQLNGYAWAPDGSNTGVQYDYADIAAYKDESTTPHTSHSGPSSNYGFQCKVCHNTHIDDFAGTHNKDNTSFQDVLETGYTFDSLSKVATEPEPSYDDGNVTGTCSTVYCHSNGGVNDGTGSRSYTYASPIWETGAKGTFGIGTGSECSRCHGNSATNMGSATHDAHLQAGYDCNICHVSTAASSTDLVGALNSPPATHVDQSLDVAFDTGSAIKSGGAAVAHGGTPYSDPAAMTCSAVYCHSSGQSEPADRNYQPISWTTAGPLGCTSCHNVPSASQTAAHEAHVNGSASNVGRDLDCAVCHTDTMDPGNNAALGAGGLATHVNGKVEVNMETAIDSGQCSNISCHSDGNYGGTQTFNNPGWTLGDTNPGTLSDCVDCHGDGSVSYPNYASGAAGSEDANSHVKHASAAESNIACEECHQTTSISGTALDGTDQTQHVDQTIDVDFKQGGTWDGTATNKTCSSTYCHGPSGTPQWGGVVNCGDCHAANNTLANSHPAHYNAASVGTFDETNVSTAGTYQINCGVCHSLTQGTSHAGGAADANYAAEVNFDGTVAEATAIYAPGGSFTSDPNGFDFSNATCSNLYCHGDFNGSGNRATPEWNNAASGSCGTCHDVDTEPPTPMDGGSHTKHVDVAKITCDYCHGGTAINRAGGIADKSLHVNQVLNWELNASKPQLTASSTYDGLNAGTRGKAQVGLIGNYATCENVYCHSDVQAVPPDGLNGVTYNAATWGGTAPCGSCHKADLPGSEQDTASHTIHVNPAFYAKSCSTCHQGAGSGTSKHADYAVDVVIGTTWGGSYDGTAAPGDAYGSCNANYCHSGGTDGTAPFADSPNVTATWNTSLDPNGTGTTCEGCHGATSTYTNTIATNSHDEHFNSATVGYEVVCQNCHDATVSGMAISSFTNHVNKSTNVAFRGNLTAEGEVNLDSDGPTYAGGDTTLANGATKAAGVAPGDCSNLYCHSIGNLDGDQGSVVTAGGADFHTITWGGAAINCDDCHGDGAGKAHPVYNSGTLGSTTANTHVQHVESSGIACASCHNSTTTDSALPPTSIDGTTHLDRIETVDFASIGGKTGTYDSTVGTKTCSTTYCHGAGTPAWGGPALDCSGCHNAGIDLADSHGAHYELAASTVNSATFTPANDSTGVTYVFTCGVCHDNISHAGGPEAGEQVAEVDFDLPLVNTATLGAPTYTKGLDEGLTDNGFTYTKGTCSATYCHSDGAGNAGNVTPQWGTTLSAECTGCHDNNEAATFDTTPGDRTMASGSHTAHVTYNTATVTLCYNCHTATVDNTDRGIIDTSVHVNRTTNVDILAALDNDAITDNNYSGGQCSNIYCHSSGQSPTDGGSAVPVYAAPVTWGAAINCGDCHVVTEVGGLTSGSHGEHLGTTGVNGCADCHTGAANDASSYNSTEHVDQTIDVANSYNAAGLPGNGYGTCTAASCHDDGTGTPAETPVWGTVVNDCSECHANDMTTASHGDHLTTTITTAITISCDNCHGNTVKATSAITDGIGSHLDANVDVYNSASGDLGYPAVNPLGANYQTCSTTYCHGDTLNYSTEDMNDLVGNVDVSPTWGANLSGLGNGCDYCHGFPPVGDIDDGNGPQHSGSTNCVGCHFHVNSTNDGFDDPSKHINRIVEAEGGDSCLDCHGSATGFISPDSGDHLVHTNADTVLSGKGLLAGDYGNNSWWYDVTYDATGRPLMGCGQCHPADESIHNKSNGIQTDLDPNDLTYTDPNLAAVAPNAKLESLAGAAYTSATGVCNNVYCHSDGAGGFADSPAWDITAYNAGITCASCHGNSPTTNAHQSHEVGIHYTELYDVDGDGLMTVAAAPGTVAAHGDPNFSTTINCYTCHSGTVTDSANAGNSTCGSCHSDTDSIVTGNELARIAASSSVHLNGQKDVAFADLSTFKSRAQLRDNLADVSIIDMVGKTLADIWTRISGYKATDGTSYDQFNAATLPTFTGGANPSCSSVACHNGETATWTDSGVDCMYCHTSVPR